MLGRKTHQRGDILSQMVKADLQGNTLDHGRREHGEEPPGRRNSKCKGPEVLLESHSFPRRTLHPSSDLHSAVTGSP